MVVGIDLGDHYATVAVWKEDRAHVIANESGHRRTPSWVAQTSEQLVGVGAKNLFIRQPKVCITNIKSLLGLPASHADVQKLRLNQGADVVDASGKVGFKITTGDGEKIVTAEEAATLLFKNLKTTAETFTGEDGVKRVVIAIPSGYGDEQKAALVRAANAAGLEVASLIPTASAAVLAHELDKKSMHGTPRTVCVVDFQARQVVASVLKVEGGAISTLGSASSSDVHGQAIIDKVTGHFAKEFEQKYKANMRESGRAVRHLSAEVEQLKISLTSAAKGAVNCESLYEGMDFHTTINRGKFEMVAGPVLRKTGDAIEDVLESLKLEPSAIDDVIVIGGLARIPKVQRLVENFFDKDILTPASAEEDVAIGAAMEAGNCEQQSTPLTPDTVSNTNKLAKVKTTTTPIHLVDGENNLVTIIAAGAPLPHTQTLTLTSEGDATAVHLVSGTGNTAGENNTLAKLSVASNEVLLHLALSDAGVLQVTTSAKGVAPVTVTVPSS